MYLKNQYGVNICLFIYLFKYLFLYININNRLKCSWSIICTRDFLIATKEELSKEFLGQKFIQYFSSVTFPTNKAIKIIYNNIQGDGILKFDDPGFDYYFNRVFKKVYGFEEFFENIESKGFK